MPSAQQQKQGENKMRVELPGLKKKVEVRGMKVSEIDMLADKRQMLMGDTADNLLKSCLQTEGHDPGTMLACDRNALLFGIRRATYGDDYEFQAQCGVCGERQLYEVNLGKLPKLEGERELVEAQLKDPKAMHKLKLPSGITVYWQFSTGEDLKKTLQIRKKKGDQLVSANLQLRIKRADGLPKDMPLKSWIREEMSAVDAEAFTDYYKECEPGLDEEIELVCQNGLCNAEFSVTMPIDPENFFKRSARKKRS